MRTLAVLDLFQVLESLEYAIKKPDEGFLTLWADKFIDSLLVRLPVPPVYVLKSNSSFEEVLNFFGQKETQLRLQTLKSFAVEDEYIPRNLSIFDELNGLRFSQLPRFLQRRLLETEIQIHIVSL